MNYQAKLLCAVIYVTMVFVLIMFGPYPQPLSYHDYADKRAYFHIPYFYNVISNVAFFIVGIDGLYKFRQHQLNRHLPRSASTYYCLFFIGIVLTAFGSAYYHWQPNNETLFWDRLPLMFAFMAAVSGLVCERTTYKHRIITTIALMLFGISSVCYWMWSEKYAVGDLRLYAVAQVLPMFIAVLMLTNFRQPFSRDRFLLLAIFSLAIARLVELTDKKVYSLLQQIVSGHTLKHLFAAFAIFMFIKYLTEIQKLKNL